MGSDRKSDPEGASLDFPTADTVSFRVDIAEMDPAFAKGQVAASPEAEH